MTCTTCGSNTPCGCSSGYSSGRDAGCCSSLVPSAPTPFYNCATPCPENHTQRVVLQQFYSTVNVVNSWNIPACGLTGTLTIQGLKSATPGSYIWNKTYGYFEITSFDVTTGTVVVTNHCNDGNAAAGTAVPACTEFIVTDPPAPTTETGNTCVAIDFTAPDVGDCLDITLTNTDNLRTGDKIQIGSGFYNVTNVKPNDIITICNNGEGIAPGTSVIAKDGSGNYQYCIAIISQSPCDEAAIRRGPALVCDGDSNLKKIFGNEAGFVLTLKETPGEQAEYLPVCSHCTYLTVPLTLVNGTASYTLTVDSSDGFSIGEIVKIPNRADYMTITSIPGGGHQLIGDFTPVPTLTETIVIDTPVCTLSACDRLDAIACDETLYNDHVDGFNFPAGAFTILHTATPSDAVYTSFPAVYDPMVNNSTCRNMDYQEAVTLQVTGSISLANTDPCVVKLELLRSLNGGAYTSVASKNIYFYTKTDGAQLWDLELTFLNTTLALAPAASATIGYKLQATITAGMSGAAYTATSSRILANLIGINV